jgi:hypothetical protein
MAIFHELQTRGNHPIALLGMTQYANLMIAALQFACDGKHRRDVATTIPCDG